jgi:N-acetylneuraminate synthase
VQQLLPHVDFFKIASYELLWTDLLVACARTKKPVVLSTGMATMDEIERAVATLRSAGCADLTLLHCVSGYPAPPDQCNLAAIRTLADTFGCRTGWSDHSVSPAVIHRAVHRWDAEMLEFHLDLDGEGEEYAAGHCWLPEQIGKVIDDIRTAFAADGDGEKKPTPTELPDCEWRADPDDGLRPLKSIRETWNG